jgi:hypothetical protein
MRIKEPRASVLTLYQTKRLPLGKAYGSRFAGFLLFAREKKTKKISWEYDAYCIRFDV